MMALSSLNFRDLGGIPADGGAIRSGLLFRSEGPANFTDEQFAALTSLDIRTIFDLRSAKERDEMPHQWHALDCNWCGLNVDADLRVFGNEGRDRLLKGPAPQIAVDTMVETYREIPEALLPHWAVMGESLEQGELPILVNCTAGKDRTGVAVALLLELAGVPRDAIMQDYMRSSIFGDNLKASGKLEAGFVASYGFMPSQGQVDALIGVRPDYLEAAWDVIEQGWADVAEYLADAGLDHDVQERIREFLVADGNQNHMQGEIV